MKMADIKLCRLAELLTTEILIEILIRIPLESILVCRRVCRSWYHLIGEPFFADRHQSVSPTPLTVMSVHRRGKIKSGQDYPPEVNFNTFRLKIGDHSKSSCIISFAGTEIPLHPHLKVVGSCNGLICLYSSRYEKFSHRLFVCNPILKSYTILPDPPEKNEIGIRRQLGFGYVPSTGEYKAVIIAYMEDQQDQTRLLFHVCTIQKKRATPSVSGWKTIHYDNGSLSIFGLPRLRDNYSRSTYFKGSVIWIAEPHNNEADCYSLIYFDIEKEEMQTVLLPSTVFKDSHDSIRSWIAVGVYYDDNGDDHLYICKEFFDCANIWVIEDDKCINSLKLKWVVTIHILHRASLLLLKVLPDGKLLVSIHGGFSLAYYDPETGVLEILDDQGLPSNWWTVDVPNLLGCFL